jgi:hypothetical protein
MGALGLLLLLLSNGARADVVAWLDYAGFESRLGELAARAGVAPFDAAEVAAMKAGIRSELQAAYAPFRIDFTESAPAGAREAVRFGATTDDFGVLGESRGVDYRNRVHNGAADVFTANFYGVVDEFSGRDDRAAQLDQLTTALAGTAARQLGIHLGLASSDAYSDIAYNGFITPENENGKVVTDGVQNKHLMASGLTGLTEAARETPRTLSDRARVKLEYAEGLLPATPDSVAEQAAPHGTISTAQSLSLTQMSVTDLLAVNVVGGLAAAGEEDVYRFEATAGTLLSADIMADSIFDQAVDATLYLYASDGETLLGVNDDKRYQGDLFGILNLESADPVLLNIFLAKTGTYYLRVARTPFIGPDAPAAVGDYELLVTARPAAPGDPTPAAPEPGTLVLAALLAAALPLFARRRAAMRRF